MIRDRALSSGIGASVYRRGAFDAHGDLVGHLGDSTAVWNQPAQTIFDGSVDPEAVELLKEFGDSCRARGAELVLDAPAIDRRCWGPDSVRLDSLARAVDERVGVRWLSRPADNLYPPELLFNGSYHLGARGRRIHTDSLISRLQRRVDKRPFPDATTPP